MKPAIALASTILIYLWTFAATAEDKPAEHKDPYQRIERIEFPNGVEVFLAPSAESTLTAIKVVVDTGTSAENRKNWGVAHLLEHVLFRDKELQDEMSYLQLIKEKGGNANGTTGYATTEYFGSIPAAKGSWLLAQFTRMILKPEIREEYVQKEKSTVELERGRPGAVTQILGFDPRDILLPQYLRTPGFLESEFGVSIDEEYTLAQEQLSTQRLTAKQVQTFYQDYYCPKNMRVFVAGRFNEEEVIRAVNSTWGAAEPRDCKVLPDLPKPKPRHEPYRRTKLTEGTPWAQIGTKVWDTQAVDDSIIDSYMEYVSHRLMKEMRNKKGQAYSVSANTSIVRGYGYSILEFQTQKENLRDNMDLVQKMLKDEARTGSLTQSQVDEAKNLYLSNYDLRGREAWQMMALAEGMYADYRDYGQFVSPYLKLLGMSAEEYNAVLAKYFKEDQSYLAAAKPAIFFPYDWVLIQLFIAGTTFVYLKKFLTKPFQHDQIRWVRKIDYPPLKLLEGLVLLVAWYVYAHVQFALSMLFFPVAALQSNVFTAEYMQTAASIVLGLIVVQVFLSIVPRKLMIVGDQLIVKSISYYSFSIPLSQIASVETIRPLGYPFPLKLWLKEVGYRFYFFDPRFWRRGNLVRLKNGQSYFFGVVGFPLNNLQPDRHGMGVIRDQG